MFPWIEGRRIVKPLALSLAGVLMAGVVAHAGDVPVKQVWDTWSADVRLRTEWNAWPQDVLRLPQAPSMTEMRGPDAPLKDVLWWEEDLLLSGVRSFDAPSKPRATDQELRLRRIEQKLDRILKEIEGLKGR
jgi:hypothetical protein